MVSVLKAWNTIFERFYCSDTNLLYDYVTDVSVNNWNHLPTPQEINSCIPNPRGWGTGMEDSALNGGCLLEALVLAYSLCGDETLRETARNVAEGLLRLEMNGFVARSVSPEDKKSFYPESSRDQYTHYIYALFVYAKSELCDNEYRERIKASFVRIADKCERDIVPENEYHLLRVDGKIGIVGKMWGELGAHEWLRLPMFYLAAYRMSGIVHYKEMYEKYRDEAIEKSFLPMSSKRCYCYLQMQYAMRMIYDYETDETVKKKLITLMRKNAEYGFKKSVESSIEFSKPEHKPHLAYRFVKFDMLEPLATSIEHGVHCYNTAQSERWNDNPAFYPVREVAEGAMLVALCPEEKIPEELIQAIQNMADAIDFDNYYSVYAPLLLPCAYISCIEKLRNT